MSSDATADSSIPCEKATSEPSFCDLGADELESAAGPLLSWLWEGYLAPGDVTLLTSYWKSGKTTLVSVLLSKLRQGGTFAGQALRRGSALVVSEESAKLWLARRKKLGFGDVRFLCRPFRGRPTPAEWRALIDHLAGLHARQARDLVVIDSLTRFFPGASENVAEAMTDALTPLGRLAEAGLSVLVLHHPRRRASPLGQAARGSGALPSFVEVLLEMRPCGGPADRRRRLEAQSRYDETPRDRVIELAADGSDYASLGDFETAAYADDWQALRAVLARAARPLTLREVAQDWPPGKTPSEQTLWRWLARAAAEGRVLRQGAGHRADPYRYCLLEMPEQWERRRREQIEEMMKGSPACSGRPGADPAQAGREEAMEVLRAKFVEEQECLRRLSGGEEGRPPK